MSSATPAKSPAAKKAVKAKVAPSHPAYQAMVKAAVKNLADKKGSSRAAIVKYVTANYKVSGNISLRVTQALKKLSEKKELVHASAKSSGAAGSFKLPAKEPTTKKPKAAKKPKSLKKKASPKKAAKSPSKPKAKKSVAAKKPVAAASEKPAAAKKSLAKKAAPKKEVAAKKAPAKK